MKPLGKKKLIKQTEDGLVKLKKVSEKNAN